MDSKFFKTLLELLKALCPKSRWGNVVYLILGFASGNIDVIISFIKSLFTAVN